MPRNDIKKPTPAQHSEFEEIALNFVSLKYGNKYCYFDIYGGNGDTQNGCDIKDQDGRVIVQCKCYADTSSGRKKMITQIASDCEQAYRFFDKMERFVVCCTHDRNSDTYNKIKALENSYRNIKVDIWFWDSIEKACSRFINIEPSDSKMYYSIPEDIDVPKSLIELLTSKIDRDTIWICADHGMGKTTYLKWLIEQEFYDPHTTFDSIVWVDYSGTRDIKKDIESIIHGSGRNFEDINNENNLVLIDNGDTTIDLSCFRFRSIVATCSFDALPAVQLKMDLKLAKRIFLSAIHNTVDENNESLNRIIKKTSGHPYVASLLGMQALEFIKSHRTINDYYRALESEGFELKTDNTVETVAKAIATRFTDDFNKLSLEEKRVLKCFCLLNCNDVPLDVKSLRWMKNDQEIFQRLKNKGFLTTDLRGEKYVMHEIMRATVRNLCGPINYDDIRDFVHILGDYIDRENLNGKSPMSIYEEVYHAYSVFINFSGENYTEKKTIDDFEYEPEYAWMVNNVFSMFDDYQDDRAYEGSKYAVRLCKKSFDLKGMSAIKLASSYNCIGYLPSAYKNCSNDEEKLGMISENIYYLLKAKDLVDQMKEHGEEHPVFEAKLHSNLGGIWQNLHRMLSEKSAISRAREGHERALAIRKQEMEKLKPEDKEWYKRFVDVIRSQYTLATDLFYDDKDDEAIEAHYNVINMYKGLGGRYEDRLYVSYSRLANTLYKKAAKTGNLDLLISAFANFQEAEGYLEKLSITNREAAIDFYSSFFKASVDLCYNIEKRPQMKVIAARCMNNNLDKIIEFIEESSMPLKEKDSIKKAIYEYQCDTIYS